MTDQPRKTSNEESIVHDKMLMRIRNAKGRDQRIRYMVAARKAGYTYEMIGLAAGVSRQQVQQIIATHSGEWG